MVSWLCEWTCCHFVITCWLDLPVLSACRGFHPYFSIALAPPSRLDEAFATIGSSRPLHPITVGLETNLVRMRTRKSGGSGKPSRVSAHTVQDTLMLCCLEWQSEIQLIVREINMPRSEKDVLGGSVVVSRDRGDVERVRWYVWRVIDTNLCSASR